MESLISFDGFSDVANNLINKISSVVGWVATRESCSKIAVDTYIKDIQNSDFDPLTKAALISKAKKTIKEYCNQANIVNRAIGIISSTAKLNNIDSDWIAQFMDKARLVSDEEFQIFWSHLLAEECNDPGSIPKALLHVMEQMDKSMANAFMAIASVSVSYLDDGEIEYNPVIINDKLKTYYESIGITFESLLDLQSIGLIKMNTGLSGKFGLTCSEPVTMKYFGDEYTLQNEREIRGCLGNVVYTSIGEALCKAVTAEKIDGFFEEICIPFWEKNAKKS